MKPTNNPNRLTRQEQRLFDMLRRGGRYTVADITRELGQCDPRGHISRMRRKGIGIADKRVTRPDGVNFLLYQRMLLNWYKLLFRMIPRQSVRICAASG